METQTDNDDQLLTYKQAAAIVGLSHTTIAKWVKLGALKRVVMPGSKHGRIRRSTLIETIQQLESSAAPDGVYSVERDD